MDRRLKMAEMQDLEVDTTDTTTELGEIEAVEQQQEERQQVIEDVIPDRYKGKSIADIAKMHQEAEKIISRQGQEVGEIRKLADELIKSQLQPKPKEPEPVKEVDFFENPQEAVRRAVESSPDVQAAKQYAVQAQQEMAKQKLYQAHPDTNQIVADPAFQQWVAASPVRQQLLQAADQRYDLNAAHELLSTYKEIRNIRAQQAVENVKTEEKTARTNALKSASVDSGGTGESGTKVYRRADLIRLKMTDPNRYESMNDEILLAYSQGRVR